jgi:transposase-like protein
MEQEFRKQAIESYLKGDSPKSIYRDLDRPKNWFFKWLKRYQSGEPNWYEDQSRAPRKRPKAIKWELTKAGQPLPSDSTIKRVLRQEGLIKKNSIRPQRGRVSLFQESLRH